MFIAISNCKIGDFVVPLSLRKWLMIAVAFFTVNLLVRSPGFFQEMRGLHFCDEDMFVQPAFNMYRLGKMRVPEFHSGGINYYLPVYVGHFIEFFRGKELGSAKFRRVARFATAGLLNALGVIWFIWAGFLLTRSAYAAMAAGLIYSLSPMMLSTSRYLYPDHYIVFFAAGVMALMTSVITQRPQLTQRQLFIRYILAGVLAGFGVSVKYSGGLLCVAIAFAYVLSLLPHWRNPRKLGKLAAGDLKFGILAAVAAGLVFLATNPEVFARYDQFLRGLQVKHYVPHSSWLRGRLHYVNIVLFTSLGVFGWFAYATGLRFFLRKNRLLLCYYSSLPMLMIFIFGKYSLIFNRNLVVVMPFALMVAIGGVWQLMGLCRNRGWWRVGGASCLVLIFGGALLASSYAFVKDFQVDARMAVKEWFDQRFGDGTLPPDTTILSNSGCTYKPLIESGAKPNADACYDFIVLDSWFGGVDPAGKVKGELLSLWRYLKILDHKEFHYMTETKIWGSGPIHKYLKSEHILHEQIKGYGPTVSIFKNQKFCSDQSG